MKDIMITILRKGYSTTKKYNSEKLCKRLYILRNIIEDDEIGIKAKNNDFWKIENAENRRALLNDISNISKFNIQDRYYFHILNEFENGNHYGIKSEEIKNENL